MTKWKIKKCSAPIEKLMSFYGCRKPLAYALYHRHIRDTEKLREYRDTDNFKFEPFTDFRDAQKAFSIVKKAIAEGKKICIYGDYDADGVTSTVILCKGLSYLGADVEYDIPHRIRDGYGLGINAVKKMEDIDLLITCDNGIAAFDAITLAKEKGMDVIVLDHHEPMFTENNGKREIMLPPADAIIDAKIEGCGYQFTQMCAGALCFRFIKGFYGYMDRDFPFEKEFTIFAAIATICDVMDLIGENRAIAKKGIELLNGDIPNTGLKKLVEMKVTGNINAHTIGFIIGPCINAAGRLNDAGIAAELFMTDDEESAEELSGILISLNEERKAMTENGFAEITELVESTDIINDKIIVVMSSTIHEGIVGLVAGKLKEKYNRPVIVLTKTEKCVKGSGRSIGGYNIHEELCRADRLLLGYGGHAMAAGLSLEEKNLESLRRLLNENCSLTEEDMQPVIRVDGKLEVGDITLESISELDALQPENADDMPLFTSLGVSFRSIEFMGSDKNSVRFEVKDDSGIINARHFRNAGPWKDKIEELGNEYKGVLRGDIVYEIRIDTYRGIEPQIIVKDIRFN